MWIKETYCPRIMRKVRKIKTRNTSYEIKERQKESKKETYRRTKTFAT